MNHNSFETSHNVTLTLAVGLIFTFGLNFDYLMVRGNTLESTHKAKYRLKIDKSFTPLGEFHHQPIYDGVKFNVSMAAFSKGDSIILMHAEMHTDGSGGLDYSKLKAETLMASSLPPESSV